jgi:anti-sigma-K factor RskA
VNDRDEQNVLTGAYSLDALSAKESATFAEYLASSEEARAEVASLTDTAVLLGLASTPVTPSPQLKAGLMAAVRSTPQATADEPAPEAPTEPQDARVRKLAGGTRAETLAHAAWFRRPIVIVVAAAAAVALFVGGNLVGMANAPKAPSFSQAQATSLAELSTASDLQKAAKPVEGGGTATLIWSLSLQRSAVLINDLPALPAGKTYQLWYIDSSGATSAGTFESVGDGKTWRVLSGKMSGGDTVGVTVEPDGGSKKPTTTPILAIASA